MNENIGLQLKLLSNDPIFVKDIPVHCIPLKKIIQIGFENYLMMINILCITQNKVDSIVNNEELNIPTLHLSTFEFILGVFHNDTIKNYLIEILSLVCDVSKEDIEVDMDNKKINIGKKSLTEDMFEEFQNVVRYRNGLNENEELNENPADERTRQLLEKRKKFREKLNEVKKNDSSDIDLSDLISVYANNSNLPLNQILEYDLYQFNNQFIRMRMYEDYMMGVKSLLAGAKSEDVNLKTYLRKINTNDDDD